MANRSWSVFSVEGKRLFGPTEDLDACEAFADSAAPGSFVDDSATWLFRVEKTPEGAGVFDQDGAGYGVFPTYEKANDEADRLQLSEWGVSR